MIFRRLDGYGPTTRLRQHSLHGDNPCGLSSQPSGSLGATSQHGTDRQDTGEAVTEEADLPPGQTPKNHPSKRPPWRLPVWGVIGGGLLLVLLIALVLASPLDLGEWPQGDRRSDLSSAKRAEPGGEVHALTTSAGEELRLGISLMEARRAGWEVSMDFSYDSVQAGFDEDVTQDLSSDDFSDLEGGEAGAGMGAQTGMGAQNEAEESGDLESSPKNTCRGDERLWWGGVCWQLVVFEIWQHHGTAEAKSRERFQSQVLPRDLKDCTFKEQKLCRPPSSQWSVVSSSTFKALRPWGDHVLSGQAVEYFPIHALYSADQRFQFLNKDPSERQSYLQEHSYSDEGVLFYALAGKGFGNDQLYRWVQPAVALSGLTTQGPWYYGLMPQSSLRLDGSLGAIERLLLKP